MKWIWTISIFILFSFLYTCNGGTYTQGERLYNAHCESCHMEDGKGLEELIPPLTDAEYLSQNRDNLACILKYGMDGPVEIHGKIYTTAMAGVEQLNAIQIANILNYINDEFDNELEFFSPGEIEEQLKKCNKHQ